MQNITTPKNGYLILFKTSILFLPTEIEVVVHSPTPSIVNIAAFSNGDGKNALLHG